VGCLVFRFAVGLWLLFACVYICSLLANRCRKIGLRCIVGFWLWLGGGSGFFLYFSF